MQLKVLLLTDGVFPYVLGGMQKHSFFLAKLLISKGVDLTLYHAYESQKEIDEEKLTELLGSKNFKVRSFPFPKTDPLPGHYLRENIQLSKNYYHSYLTEAIDYDLIYAQGFTGHAFIKQKSPTPIFINFHGYEMFQKPASKRSLAEHLLLRKTVKWMSRNAEYVFSFGGHIEDILDDIGVPKSRQIEFPIGIGRSWAKEFVQGNREIRNFIFVGRYERRKGIEELNKALNQLIKLDLPFQFQFIGPIPENVRLNDARITYHGRIDSPESIKEILNTSDILVTPSYSEGMPTVILEAMSQGLAIIATDVGAVAKLVDNSNGWLINPGNTSELFNTITYAIQLEDAELLSKKKSSLKRFKANYIWEELIEKLMNVFTEKISSEQMEKLST